MYVKDSEADWGLGLELRDGRESVRLLLSCWRSCCGPGDVPLNFPAAGERDSRALLTEFGPEVIVLNGIQAN